MSAIAEPVLWLLVLLPAAVGALLTVAPRLERVAAPVAVGAALVTVALSVVAALERTHVSAPFLSVADFALRLDPLSAVVAPTVAVVTLLVLVFSAGEIAESRGRFHGLMLVFAASALVTTLAENLLTLLFAWELMGASSYALIGFWWREPRRVSAGLTAFLTTRTADLGLYAAAGAALAGGAGLVLADLPASTEGWRHVIALGVLVAALGKAAQLPFSFWLSRAMEGPSPVSALLHSAAMVAMGGYLLLRTEPLLASTGWSAPAAAWAGGLTALVLGVVALAQRDLKQLLAASTSAQLGFVVMAAGVASVSGGAAHLAAHASTKALLFLAAGAWLTLLGSQSLDGLHGVARRWRAVGWAATAGALALAGVAPLSLWATKDEVLAAALEESPWLYAVGIAASALSAAYAAKVLVVIWARPARARRREREAAREIGPMEQAPLVVLAVGAVGLALLALPPVGTSLGRALGEADNPVATPVELVASAALAVAVLVGVWRWRAPEPGWAVHWLGLERAATVTLVHPTLRLAAALAWFDDQVLDRGVTATAAAALRLARRAAIVDDRALDRGVEALSAASLRAARRAAATDDRWLDGAVEWSAAQVRALGRLARRPQTGLLHQYYIQVVAVLAIGVLVLVTVR